MALNHDSYSVGWICALPIEMAAAKCLLDETHPALHQPRTDTNSYTLGRIESHNVVIACLPSGVYGTTSAAVVAKQMATTFPSLRFGLLVGIGGGVPITSQPSADIRLGDIVVSIPLGPLPGVIAYDHGKKIENGKFLRTGALNHPPHALLTAVNNLRSSYMLGQGRMGAILDHLATRYPDFRSPGPDRDRLFDSSSLPALSMSEPPVLERPVRPSTTPRVHYGTIASGNSLLKHGKTRDALSAEHDILCFEMEAAGIMDLDHFPCLVIRGISDYADEFKAKEWQAYAAAAAAAYTKELLGVIQESATDPPSGLPDPASTSTASLFPSSILSQVFPVEENFLGSLTTDSLWPRQNFHAPPTPPARSQIVLFFQTRPHTLNVSTAGHTSFFSSATIKGHGSGSNSDRSIAVDRSSSCMLKNSDDWFERMSTERRTRQWIEKQLLRSQDHISLVVGFRSLGHRDISLIPTGDRESSATLPCVGEVVYAVQYRELKFKWFRRRDIDAARLQKGNCWRSLYTERGDDEDADEAEDYLEVVLDEGIAEASITGGD